MSLPYDSISAEYLVAHEQFRGMMLNESFACIGGASAVRRGNYQFALLPELASEEAIVECCDALRKFVSKFPAASHPVAVFVAAFRGPLCENESDFESRLWDQLQGMHDSHGQRAWFSADDSLADRDDELGFIFDDRNFFVVGMHPAASRWSRRYAWPTLVFNALSHAEHATRLGQFDRMRDRIRSRDQRLQGSLNPTVSEPQVAQFSGRDVGPDWQCPLRPRLD